MRVSLFLPLVLFMFSCSERKSEVDLILHNGVIYSVDSAFSKMEAIAIKEGKIVETGTSHEILERYKADEMIDAGGKAVFPGFIDAHCHFYNYGLGLNQVDLVGTKSFEEVLQRVNDFAKRNAAGNNWIIGRGWDQNDWEVKEYPDRKKLDSLFPDRPVFLKRIDGHAALANREALLKAGITSQTKISGGRIEFNFIPGGEEIWTEKNSLKEVKHMRYPLWVPTGILIDNAVDLVEKKVPEPTAGEMKVALLAAQKNCFEVGLTTVDDAGLMKKVIDEMDRLQRSGELKMRIYAMLSDSAPNYAHYLGAGPYTTERLNVRSFKFYGDGGLGSRGACLKEDYSDRKGWRGFFLKAPGYYAEKARIIAGSDFQFNAHCIGDSAAKMILSLAPANKEKSYLDYLMSGSGNDPRWRMEHAQVVDEIDQGEFRRRSIIPSVQPTHATSDMYWVMERLGEQRIKFAYAYRTLLKNAGIIALGTDFPVEDISPFKTFYAAVFRKDAEGFPAGGFQIEEALTREETIKGMTIWAAYANFEEKEKGSLEKGKFADFVILDTDLMNAGEADILKTKVLFTFLNGEKVFERK